MIRVALLGLLLVPLAIVGAAIAVIAFKGRWWRIAASLPLAAVAGYFAVVLIPAWVRDPTSHNLFPFELGLFFWPAFPYMAVLAAAYWRSHRREAASS